jgi:GntR family transcriptional regulator
MLLRIDSLSPEPIFEQVVFQVKSAVARGELSSGDKLPSVRELAKELTINPNTVARAYEALEGQGVIVRRQGAGCFVTGETSGLRLDQRRKKLDQLMHRAVTEAFHIGADGSEVRASLERHLRRQAIPESRSRTP